MPVALSLAGGFAVGFALRAWLQRYFAVAFRTQFALGIGSLAVLAGWAYQGGVSDLLALGLLLAAQIASVLLGAWLFRHRREGPMLAFGMFGNPTMWSLPIAAAGFGARGGRARRLRHAHAAADRARRPAAAAAGADPAAGEDRADRLRADGRRGGGRRAGAVRGGALLAPGRRDDRGDGAGRVERGAAGPRVARRALAAAAGAGAGREGAGAAPDVRAGRAAGRVAGRAGDPAGAVGARARPFPMATLSFSRLYGFSARQAASGLALSTVVAVALLPLALALP